MWAATEKFTKRSTAKIIVKPMAGTASTVPAIRPFSVSWTTFSSTSDLHLDQLSVLDLRGAERDLDDVAVLGKLARAGCARVLALLAVGYRLQAIERVVDLHGGIVVRDLADVVADAGAARILALGHPEDRQIGVVVGLANVGIERVALHQCLQARVSRRAAGWRGLGDAEHSFGGFLARPFDKGRRDAKRETHDLALVVGA